MVGDNPTIESTGGFSKPNATIPTDSRYCRSPSFMRISKPSVDLPDPETPVRTTSFPLRIVSVTFFRLCSRALLIVIQGSIDIVASPPSEALDGSLFRRCALIVKPWWPKGGLLRLEMSGDQPWR